MPGVASFAHPPSKRSLEGYRAAPTRRHEPPFTTRYSRVTAARIDGRRGADRGRETREVRAVNGRGYRMARLTTERADVVVTMHFDRRSQLPRRVRHFKSIPNMVDDRLFLAARRSDGLRVPYCCGLRAIKWFDLLLESWPRVVREQPHARSLGPGCRPALDALPRTIAATVAAPTWLDSAAFAGGGGGASVVVPRGGLDRARPGMGGSRACRRGASRGRISEVAVERRHASPLSALRLSRQRSSQPCRAASRATTWFARGTGGPRGSGRRSLRAAYRNSMSRFLNR